LVCARAFGAAALNVRAARNAQSNAHSSGLKLRIGVPNPVVDGRAFLALESKVYRFRTGLE
jgi:hypothetical protein